MAALPLRPRSTALLALLAALAATVALALGLPRLVLGPGMPLPTVQGSGVIRVDLPLQGGSATIATGRAAAVLLIAGGSGLVLYALWRALRGARWRSTVPALVRGMLMVGALCAVVVGIVSLVPGGRVELAELQVPEPAPAPRAPLGPVPRVITWLVAAGLLVGLGLVTARLVRADQPERDALGVVGLEAERAWNALRSGEETRDAIARCYERMTTALAEEQGIERPGSMTAREFEELLGSLGLPRGPVRELTGLFEAVRYGGRASTADEAARAIACLGSIVASCRVGPGA
jgi:hypothetical protein